MVRYQQGESAAIEELRPAAVPLPDEVLFVFAGLNGRGGGSLQDCWLRIHRSRQTYRASEPVLALIFAIARHTRLDGHRRRQRRISREVLVADPPENPAPLPVTRGDGSDELMKILGQIPESQREVILMLKVWE